MTAKTIRALRAALIAVAMVLLSCTPALLTATPAVAQYGGADIQPQKVTMGNMTQSLSSSSVPIMVTQRTLVIQIQAGPLQYVDVYIQSDPVFLGQFQADENGKVNAIVTIPDTIESGNHTLVAKGTNSLGKRIELRQPIQFRADLSSSQSPDQLSLTGSNAKGIAAVGGVLFVVGAAATVATRRRLSDPTFSDPSDV